MKKTISEKIKKKMQSDNISINELSRITGLARNTVLNVLNCRSYSIDTLERILKKLNLELV